MSSPGKKDQSDINITRAHRGTECWSDHRLIRSKVSFTVSYTKRKTAKAPPRKLNVAALKNPEKVKQLQDSLEEKLKDVEIDDDIEKSWKLLKESLADISKELLGFPKCSREDWFDESDEKASQLINDMHKAHNCLMNDKCSNVKKSAYRRTKAAVQKSLRQMKEAWWSKKAQQIQAAADSHNLKAFYDGLNGIFGPTQSKTSPIDSKDGSKTLTEEPEILARWAEHFKGVLNQESNVDWDVLKSLPEQPLKEELSIVPSLSEVLKAIKQLSMNKAPGDDGIPGEIFIHGGHSVSRKLTKLIKVIWQKEEVPQDFKDANIIKLYKKGKRSVCDNYRGISLLSIAGKVLSRIILNRLNNCLVDSICSDSQCGFRKGRGTTDMIFSLRQIQEKAREQRKPLYMLFIDLTKAFDTVNRKALWLVLSKIGVPDKL